MRDWNYLVNHPATLTIAADARLSPINQMDDQVWELNLGNSEPPAISLQTTFGLRARSCRIFPRFISDGQIINNPEEFHRPITIHRYYPNYLNLSFKPFQYFNVILEYWVPDSQSIACRTRINNTSREKRDIQIEWAELLIPTEDGHRMTTDEMGLVNILVGRTASLSPILFLSGGSQPGKSPYPSLDLFYSILPHQDQEMFWAHVCLAEINDSYEHAKMLMSKNWDTEIARVIRVNSQRIEIITGDQEWDSAFYLSQTLADQLLINSKMSEPASSYLYSRKPDQAHFSPIDNADFNRQVNTSSARGIYYLMNFLLPAAPEIVKALLNNLLSSQIPRINPDEKYYQDGGSSPLLATPLLSSMIWEYYRYTGAIDYLQDTFQALLSMFFTWFTIAHDRDSDLIPEWDQPAQTGFEENPLFSFIKDSSIGIDITTIETPDLISYLYSECKALIAITHEIDHQDSVPQLESITANLKDMIAQTWDDKQACFLYRDRDTHISTNTQILGSRKGSGLLEIHQDLIKPVRPLIQITSIHEGTRPVQLYIQGVTSSGSHRVDHIQSAQFHWHLNMGYVTSRHTYKHIEQVEVTGISNEDEMIVRSTGMVGLDITQLLPLWAGISSDEQSKVLINLTIMNKKKFLSPYGLRSFIRLDPNLIDDEISSVRLEWITYVIKGMLSYGERKKAAELFIRLIKAVSKSLSQDLTLHQQYHEDTGKPLGTANSLFSLVPIELFLEVLGIKIFNPTRVEILGGNPFPWPATIKYRGLTVVHQEKKTLVIFSDGQNITIDNQLPMMVTQGISESS